MFPRRMEQSGSQMPNDTYFLRFEYLSAVTADPCEADEAVMSEEASVGTGGVSC